MSLPQGLLSACIGLKGRITAVVNLVSMVISWAGHLASRDGVCSFCELWKVTMQSFLMSSHALQCSSAQPNSQQLLSNKITFYLSIKSTHLFLWIPKTLELELLWWSHINVINQQYILWKDIKHTGMKSSHI